MRYEYGIETEDKRERRYGMVIESCSRCLFETLCRLEKDKEEREKSEKSLLDHKS